MENTTALSCYLGDIYGEITNPRKSPQKLWIDLLVQEIIAILMNAIYTKKFDNCRGNKLFLVGKKNEVNNELKWDTVKTLSTQLL